MTFQISGAICKSKHSAVTQSAEQDAKSTWKAFMQHVLRLRSRWHLKSFYLAEPHVFLTITSIMMHVFCFNSTLYKFACLYEFNQSLCESLNKTNTNDPLVIRVQKRSSNWTMIANAAFGLCSLMASNVFGSLSDGVVNKRHLLGFISFGVCVCGGILIGVAGQTESSLMMPVGLFIFQLLSGLIASSMVLISTANGYLSVVTEKKDRALRFSCLELSFLIGSAIGNAAVGVTVQKHGTKVAIGLSCGLSGLALLYSLVMMKKSPVVAETSFLRQKLKTKIKNQLKSFYTILFDFSDSKERYAVLIVVSMYFLGSIGSWTTMLFTYMYLKRPPIAMDDSSIGVFNAVNNAAQAVGLSMILPILKVKFKVKDSFLVLVGFTSMLGYLIVITFVKSSTWIFSATLLSLATTMDAPSIRSLVTLQVSNGQEGRAIGLISSAQSLAFFISVLVMPPLYNLSASTKLPGMVFLIGAVLNLLAILFLTFSIRRGVFNETNEVCESDLGGANGVIL